MRIETYYKLNENWGISNNPSVLYSSAIKQIIEESQNSNPQVPEEDLNLVNNIFKELTIATKFITTFGTGVGALYPAVIRFLENSSISLNKQEAILLIITAISIITNSPEKDKLKEIVEKKGLKEILKAVKDFIVNLSKIVGSSVTDMLGYTSLLVPTVNIITQLIDKQKIGIDNIEDLFKGLAASASAYGIKTLIDKSKDKK